ncbi:MAG: hypothetical protein IJ036_02520 [Lachnospiraceae bacterium]|nr:hypothetical protein [Lachnospiraceae bacterium]
MDNAAQPKALKILFIGNSATSVNNVPYTLLRLAGKVGYDIEVATCTNGGYTLSQHADESTPYGQTVYEKISNQYDIVFLQENCSCISNEVTRQNTKDACKKLNDAIIAAGGETYVYVRPPYGYPTAGYEPFEQCIELDKLFSEISSEVGTTNAYVNRAFAYAMEMEDCNFSLWGSDNAHTSAHGAYLVVCVMFATLFETSATVLDHDTLPPEDALILQQIADKIVLENHILW